MGSELALESTVHVPGTIFGEPPTSALGAPR